MNDTNQKPLTTQEIKLDPKESIQDFVEKQTLTVGSESPQGQAVETPIATLEQIYQRYEPCVFVDFEDEDGEQHTEKIHFDILDDFTTRSIRRKSEFLLNLQLEQDYLANMIQQLKSDATLRGVLKNEETRKAFLATLEALIQEISE